MTVKKKLTTIGAVIIVIIIVLVLSPFILFGGIIVWYNIRNADTPQQIERRAHIHLPEYNYTFWDLFS